MAARHGADGWTDPPAPAPDISPDRLCTMPGDPPHDIRHWLAAPALLLAAAIAGCARQQTPESRWGPHWYHRTRAMALVGRSPADSVVLDAYGTRLDSLAVFARFFVNGALAHQEDWYSGYELIDEDSLLANPVAMSSFLRNRFDTTLASVEVEPFDMNEMRMMGDTNVLRDFPATPDQDVVFSVWLRVDHHPRLEQAHRQVRGALGLLLASADPSATPGPALRAHAAFSPPPFSPPRAPFFPPGFRFFFSASFRFLRAHSSSFLRAFRFPPSTSSFPRGLRFRPREEGRTAPRLRRYPRRPREHRVGLRADQ